MFTSRCPFSKMTLFAGISLLLVLSSLCVSHVCAQAPPAGVMETNVTFTSLPSSSGVISLHGTIVRPVGNGPFPAVVTVSGSGPNDRWEEISNGIAPFRGIAYNLASRGYAVLAYDKRSCTQRVHPLCTYEPCTGGPGVPAGCVDFTNLTMTDFARDAAAAIKFLTAQPFAQSSGATLIGHSQGCTDVPVANQILRDSTVSNIVLLMGSGVPIDQLLRDQMQTQMPLYLQAQKYWLAQPASAQRTAALTKINGTIGAGQCTIDYAVSQYDLLRNGTITTGEHAVICAMGVYWAGGLGIPAGVSCPAACGTGRCAVGENSDECLEQCKIGAELAGCSLLPFAESELFLTSLAGRTSAQSALKGRRVLSINGWQDLLVTPETFLPLHKELTGIESSLKELTIHTISNITHDLTDMPFKSPRVSPRVMAVLDDFLPAQQ